MKKLLSILGAIGIVVSSATTVVACGGEAENDAPMLPERWSLNNFGDPEDKSNVIRFFQESTHVTLDNKDTNKDGSTWYISHSVDIYNKQVTIKIGERHNKYTFAHEYTIDIDFSFDNDAQNALNAAIKESIQSEELKNNDSMTKLSVLSDFLRDETLKNFESKWTTDLAKLVYKYNLFSIIIDDLKATDFATGVNFLQNNIIPNGTGDNGVYIKSVTAYVRNADHFNSSIKSQVTNESLDNPTPMNIDEVTPTSNNNGNNLSQNDEDTVTLWDSITSYDSNDMSFNINVIKDSEDNCVVSDYSSLPKEIYQITDGNILYNYLTNFTWSNEDIKDAFENNIVLKDKTQRSGSDVTYDNEYQFDNDHFEIKDFLNEYLSKNGDNFNNKGELFDMLQFHYTVAANSSNGQYYIGHKKLELDLYVLITFKTI